MLGPAGTGTSHTLIAQGHAAIAQGHAAAVDAGRPYRHVTAAQLVENRQPRPCRQQRRALIESVLCNDLVIVDGRGSLPSTHGRRTLFWFVAAHCGRPTRGHRECIARTRWIAAAFELRTSRAGDPQLAEVVPQR